MPTYSRSKHTISVPSIADDTIERRIEALGMSFTEYVASLIAYDCWAEKPHILTGQACTGEKEDEERLWREIIADAGKPDKTGSYFEHRAREFFDKKPPENPPEK